VGPNLPQHDKAAAEQALKGKPVQIRLLQPTVLGPTFTAAAELIQQSWQAVGVQVTIQPVDAAGLNQALFSTGAWDVSMAPVTLALPSQLVPFASGPTPTQGVNFGHVRNAEFESESKQAASMPGSEGCEHWNKAEAALVKSVDLVPYFDSVVPTFVKGAKFTLSDGIDPASIRMLAS
jgi:peptide/nickel transport system substrate-binding protein